MSLTNPNSVVTEERLSDFYQGILPYLGGMPDILANKFNKSDLYSTDEKIVGQWVDGKPLYQRVVTMDTVTKATNWATVESIPGIEVKSFSGNALMSGITINLPYRGSTGLFGFSYSAPNLQYITDSSSSFSNVKLIITYTKTTDSPVEIGIDTDYSTTEKIVGTWVDGKPLYQRTFYITDVALKANDRTIIFSISDLSSLSIDKVVGEIDGFANFNNGANTISIPYSPGSATSTVCAYYDSGYGICIYRSGNGFTANNLYLTVQYTKTTD